MPAFSSQKSDGLLPIVGQIVQFRVNTLYFAGHFVIVANVFIHIPGGSFIFNISWRQRPFRTSLCGSATSGSWHRDVDNRRGSSAPATGIGKCSPPHPQPLAPSPDIWHSAPPPFGAIPPRHSSPLHPLARWWPGSREMPKDMLKTGRLCLRFFPKSYRQEMAPWVRHFPSGP